MTGKHTWAIPEGYIPRESTGPEPELISHESLCVLNTTDEDATLEITVYFTGSDPIGPYETEVPANRTRHFRFNEFEDPEPVPKGEPFASVIESDIPVVCQHTRLDSRQAENALLSTVAYGE
ncbi:hypothetical protein CHINAEXTREME_13465 [Halobiforma lacisalsi AJ5]|nr:sensory rhodopsin transducer [Halobiforma lacisalsi]APX00090.1 hypothetical protein CHINAEXTREME_13465 [Halobiforma lacisalsi AJ5]